MILTEQQTAQEYLYAIRNESINTCSTPQYPTLKDYIKMLRTKGIKVIP